MSVHLISSLSQESAPKEPHWDLICRLVSADGYKTLLLSQLETSYSRTSLLEFPTGSLGMCWALYVSKFECLFVCALWWTFKHVQTVAMHPKILRMAGFFIFVVILTQKSSTVQGTEHGVLRPAVTRWFNAATLLFNLFILLRGHGYNPICVTTHRYSLLLTLLFIYVMGGACSPYGGEERRIQDFGGEIWRKQTTWKTQASMGG